MGLENDADGAYPLPSLNCRAYDVRMALSNIAFITFLALKNTPLAFLTAYSHERLNQLHQIGGYTTIVYVITHLSVIVKAFVKNGGSSTILQMGNIHGMIAACALFVTLIAAVIIRRLKYEAFYVIHVLMYMIIIINIGLHQPSISLKAVIVRNHFSFRQFNDRKLGASIIIVLMYFRSLLSPDQCGPVIVFSAELESCGTASATVRPSHLYHTVGLGLS
jgi:hypothetical protein